MNGKWSDSTNPTGEPSSCPSPSPRASKTQDVTPSLCHSLRVSSMLPPEWVIPAEAPCHAPMGGTGFFIIDLMCPEIERSSGWTPLKELPSNLTLLGVPPPMRCRVMDESVRLPGDTNNAAFTALANTSTLPEPPVRSFNRSSPDGRASWPMIAKCRCRPSPHAEVHVVDVHHRLHLPPEAAIALHAAHHLATAVPLSQ